MDLTIYETGNGGDLQLLGNDISQTDSIFNQIYMALFSGLDFWGDEILDTDFNSTTEQILKTTVLNSAGLEVIENAIKQDLKFLNEIADIELQISLIEVDKLEVIIKANELEHESLGFIWDSTKETIIINKTL